MLTSIVHIESKNKNNQSFGTGFIFHNNQNGSYILTCQHVLDDVKIPVIDNVEATITAPCEFIDMAVIFLPNIHLEPLAMQVDSCDSLDVDVIGFSIFSQNLTQKKHIQAQLFKEPIELHANDSNSFYRARKIKADNDFHFSKGNSGSPVICKHSGHVIGMISNKEGNDIAYAIEISYIEEVWKEMPKGLLEKDTSREYHNHLHSHKRKSSSLNNTTAKPTQGKLRYFIAGLITMILLVGTYFLFIDTKKENTLLNCQPAYKKLAKQKIDTICTIQASSPHFQYALFKNKAVSISLLEKNLKLFNPDSLYISQKNNNWYLNYSKYAQVFHVKKDDMLNIRQKPSSSSKIVNHVRNGTLLQVLSCTYISESSKWCSVKFGKRLGWVNSRYLQYVNPQALYNFHQNRVNADKALEEIKKYHFNALIKVENTSYLVKKRNIFLPLVN